MTSLGAGDYVNAVNNDFFDLSSDLRDAAEAILLDPSCSASGVISRVDSLGSARSNQNKKQQVEEGEEGTREDKESDKR